MIAHTAKDNAANATNVDKAATNVLVKTDDLAVFTRSEQGLVEPISVTLYKGQNLTILGETGSGKSLLASKRCFLMTSLSKVCSGTCEAKAAGGS